MGKLAKSYDADGDVTVDFGEPGEIFDALTGEKAGTGPICDFALKAGDARLFRIESPHRGK